MYRLKVYQFYWINLLNFLTFHAERNEEKNGLFEELKSYERGEDEKFAADLAVGQSFSANFVFNLKLNTHMRTAIESECGHINSCCYCCIYTTLSTDETK